MKFNIEAIRAGLTKYPWTKHSGLFIILFLATAIYLVRFTAPNQIGVTQDDAAYLVLTKSFAIGQPYRIISNPLAPPERIWPPGYPLFVLYPLWLIVGPRYEILRASSLILALANIVLMHCLLKGRLKEPLLTIAVGLFALNTEIAKSATLIMSESAFIFFSLCFFLLLEKWLSKPSKFDTYFLSAVVFLAMAFWTRYWGIALFLSSFIYLIIEGRGRWALMLGVLFLSFSLPFIVLFSSQQTEIGSYFAIQALTGRIFNFQNLHESIINYWQVIPFILVQFIGPKVINLLSRVNLIGLVYAFRFTVIAILIIGLAKNFSKHLLFSLYVVIYSATLFFLTGHIELGGQLVIFDEPRYTTVVLPFLYFFLILGTYQLGQWVFHQDQVIHAVILTGGVSMMGLLVVYNIYQAHVPFNVPSLDNGASWIKEHTTPNEVVMCPDPVTRYLYLNRKTIEYPFKVNEQEFFQSLKNQNAAYILITPPLTINWQPNLTHALDPDTEKVTLPIILAHPELFRLVFQDETSKTFIYQVIQK